ncbi:LON peptidase substrate-binding domain-containing protein [Alphaproteobacteria bacterium]|nr:LON peptidase substrate-binding domain-containing protein [Alphaproteobacteria bacterium]
MTKKILIPIFPLKGTILFPEANLPLNIFEERYIEMVDFALAKDKTIGMIQTNDSGVLYEVGCIGRINSFNETEDGRYIINLRGKNYFSILKEVPSNHKFRLVESTLENKNIRQNNIFELKNFNKELFLAKCRPYINKINPEIDFDLINKIEPAALIKFIAMSCPFSSADKQMLLETYNLNELAHKLIALFDYYLAVEKNERSIN